MKHRRRTPAGRRHRPRWMTTGVAVIATAMITVAVGLYFILANRASPWPPLPTTSRSYLGVYERGAIWSYAPIDRFAQAAGRQPNVVSYYSGWPEPFHVGFAISATKHGAIPLVQMNPTGVSIAAIASGQYDAYLRTFATAVRSYHLPVIVSFGHEMNGSWYSWGYRHTSPAVFVAAWRHIVTLFRTRGAGNVTWLWTINIINTKQGHIPAPAPWWPGDSYVTWVGIDGYYYTSSYEFAPLFGPTIKAVRELTSAPILIAETGVAPVAGKPAKISNLFAGIRAYGLLGFVWFNADKVHDWRVNGPAAIAAFRRGAKTFRRVVP